MEIDPVFQLGVQGYGEFGGAWLDHGPNRNRPRGAQRDSRAVLDVSRFAVQLHGDTDFGLRFEAEVEIEHQGAGGAREIEYEEFGEFENELELGGEVALEKLLLRQRLGAGFTLVAGRLIVPFGHLARRHRPTHHLAPGRPESEGRVIPVVWDEVGAGVEWKSDPLLASVHVINGLDSSGFSSASWVASGHQGVFEEIRATHPAVVLRLEGEPTAGTVIGGAFYAGGTSANRPKADLAAVCDADDGAEIAPCGWVDGGVWIASAWGHTRVGPVEASGSIVLGALDNADVISQRNARLSNALDVPRTPVASRAMAGWGEVGWDLASPMGLPAPQQLLPFVHVGWADSMWATEPGQFDNPRHESLFLSSGLAWRMASLATVKADLFRRSFGNDALRVEHGARLAAGFTF